MRARRPVPQRALLLASLLAALVAVGPAQVASTEPAVLTLTGIDDVQGLQRADVDQDGIIDLLLLSGRRLQVWRGRKGSLPAAVPTWSVVVSDDVSFLSGPPRAETKAGSQAQAPTIYAVGRGGLQRIDLSKPSSREAPAAGGAIRWRDGERATFADLARSGGVLTPTTDGWAWRAAETVHLRLPRFQQVKAPGPFLEDTCTVSDGLPEVFVGAAAGSGAKGDALWAIADRSLIAQGAGERTTYDVAFLGAGERGDFDQTLVDLDGDRRPEILHRIFTNREVHYGFFRTRPAKGSTGPSHKPAACTLSLQGFQLDPELTDLDGDGLKDLIITSMQVNAANMIAALTSGKVIAETRAFLNQSKRDAAYFAGTPDATVKSEIGVKVQFNYAGNVEVVRSLLIVSDGDFDGDGRKDLAIRTGPATLSIHRGLASGVWAQEGAIRLVSIPPMGTSPDVEGYAADLDGDGRDELVLVYRKAPGGKDIVRIIEP